MSFCVIGEDGLTCALGERLAIALTGAPLALAPINAGGVTKLKANIPRYMGMIKLGPVLCIADTDRNCPVDLLSEWLPRGAPAGFMLRFAVSEAESWVLADPDAFAAFMKVPVSRVPRNPDDVQDPKREILALAARSTRRLIREEVVSDRDPSKQGVGYNVHLKDFVSQHWRPQVACEGSPSLARAMARLRQSIA